MTRFGLIVATILAILCAPAPAFAALAQDATPPSVGMSVQIPGRIISLSPDGGSVVGVNRESGALCVYAAATSAEVACADLESRKINIRIDDIAWSPDSSKIAFAENGFVTLRDGDLWVMDASTGDLTNLTDDGSDGAFLKLGATPTAGRLFMDVLPAWSADSQSIAFSRSSFTAGETAQNDIAIVPAGGGEVRTVVTVSTEGIGIAYYGMVWSRDGSTIAYTVLPLDRDDPSGGIWTVEADGTGAKQIVGSDPERGRPVIVALDPAGTTGMVLYLEKLMTSGGPGPLYFELDMTTGDLREVPLPPGARAPAVVADAVFSPDGTRLLTLVRNTENGQQLVQIDRATGEQTPIATLENATRTTATHGVTWANDGTVFVATDRDAGVLLHIETGAAPAIAATPESVATPEGTPTPFEIGPGATVVTNDDATVRSAPSTDAPVAKNLAKGATLTVIGPSKDAEGFTWWPVEDLETGTIGYIRSEFITPID